MTDPTLQTVKVRIRLPFRLRARVAWWRLRDWLWLQRMPIGKRAAIRELRRRVNEDLERELLWGKPRG